MKKNFILISGLVLASSIGFAQNKQVNRIKEVPMKPEVGIPLKSIVNQINKAYLDTLAYEDFDSQIPVGWTLQNNAGTGNTNNWLWSNQAPGGQYSTNAAALASTTGSNGYMMLPSGLFNTPFPAGGPIAMDASFTSPVISIRPSASVLIRWQQSQRYCCSSANELVLEVSADNVTYTTYDASFGRGANTAVDNEMVEVNVSAALANQTTAYIRFRSSGNTHYYWMIDDLTILEGPSNAMVMTNQYVSYGDTNLFNYDPPYAIYPQAILDPIDFGGGFENYGSSVQTGVTMNYEVIHDSTCLGGSGSGTGFQALERSTFPNSIAPTNSASLIVATPYVNVIDGYFRARMFVTSDSVNQNGGAPTPPALIEYSFSICDTVLSRSNAPYQGSTGPGSFAGGGNDNDRCGSLFTIGQTGAICTSLSFLVGNRTSNDGAQIQPRIWGLDLTTGLPDNSVIGTSPFTTTIDASMLGQWIAIPLFPPVMLQGQKQYVAGWEQMGGASIGAEFSVARDIGREPIQPPVTNFVYIAGAWGWVPNLGAIRMNFGNLAIGVEKVETVAADFTVSPNPNNGKFSINVSNENAANYNLEVRNTISQVVYSKNLNDNGYKTQNVDLSSFEKGVYFVSLENWNERLVKKILVK